VYLVIVDVILKTTGNFLLLTSQSANWIQFPIKKDTVEENSYTVLKEDDGHKKKF